MLLNFVKSGGFQLSGVTISWVESFLGGNFLWWEFSGWELSSGNHPDGNFRGGSFHVNDDLIAEAFKMIITKKYVQY